MEIEKLYQLFLNHPSVSTDSRNINENSLFFALRGENFNGNKYASSALENGAAFAIIDDATYLVGKKTILVENSLTTLQDLARHHIKALKPQLKVIGLTGSNGKTTTKELMHAVLSKKFTTLATKGNLNNHIGVPLTCLEITKNTEVAIIEMGANHPGEIALLSSIAQPDYGIIINIGRAHLEGFGSRDGILKAKSELFDFVNQNHGKILINTNQPLLLQQAAQYSCGKLFFGAHPESSIIAEPIDNEGPYLTASVYFKEKDIEEIIQTNLIGQYNNDNLAAAAAMGVELGVQPLETIDALKAYTPKNNRSQMIKVGSNQIIMDAYNANPTSMIAAIENIDKIKSNKTKIAILGEMKELGKYQHDAHNEILRNAIDSSISQIITLGQAFIDLNVTNEKLVQYQNTEELSSHLKTNKPENSIILIKGSRSNQLEKILTYFENEK